MSRLWLCFRRHRPGSYHCEKMICRHSPALTTAKEVIFLFRLICLLIGYLFGNILTAEAVTRKITGRPCAELGATGNPGMANVMQNLGFKAGVIVLAGDILKTAAAMLICWLLFGGRLGRLAMFYAGLGAVIGHDFPFWLGAGRGGKGVTCCCALLIIYSPLGLLASIIGLAAVLITKYLCIGGMVIPAAFIIPAFAVYGPETGILTLILSALCFYKHWPAAKTIPSGQCPKNDLLGHLKK